MPKTLVLLMTAAISIMCCTSDDPPISFSVIPDSTLYHTPLKIELVGLEPESEASLSLNVVDAEGNFWKSTALFSADKEGKINTLNTSSDSGSYTGLHPMGLFWSMKSDDDHQIATGSGYTAKLIAIQGIDTVATTSFYRRSTREMDDLGIEYIQLRDDFIADFYLPKAENKRPAIIFLGGSGGQFRSERSSLLASEGFAVLNLKYFRYEGLPDGIIEIPLEYVKKAYDWLASQPDIDPSRIGIMGRSMGSELALLYAAHYDGLQYVLAEAPSSVVWFGWDDGKSSFSYEGKGFPYAEYTAEDSERIERELEENGQQYRDGPKFESAFKNAEMIEQASIPVENIQCPILFVSGEDDLVWPSEMMANRMMDRLKAKGFPYKYEHLVYRAAGHNFAGGGQGCGIPYLPPEDYSAGSAKGGTVEGNSLAAIQSWETILEFIR